MAVGKALIVGVKAALQTILGLPNNRDGRSDLGQRMGTLYARAVTTEWQIVHGLKAGQPGSDLAAPMIATWAQLWSGEEL